MKKNIWTKVLASLALFGILIWIIWTGILFIFEWGNSYTNETIELSPEEIQELINAQAENATWSIENIEVIDALDAIENEESETNSGEVTQ